MYTFLTHSMNSILRRPEKKVIFCNIYLFIYIFKASTLNIAFKSVDSKSLASSSSGPDQAEFFKDLMWSSFTATLAADVVVAESDHIKVVGRRNRKRLLKSQSKSKWSTLKVKKFEKKVAKALETH